MLSTRKVPATEHLGYITILTEATLAPLAQATYKRAWKTFESFRSEILAHVIQLPLSVSTISLFIAYILSLFASCFHNFKYNVKGVRKPISYSHGFACHSASESPVDYLKIRLHTTGPLLCSCAKYTRKNTC